MPGSRPQRGGLRTSDTERNNNSSSSTDLHQDSPPEVSRQGELLRTCCGTCEHWMADTGCFSGQCSGDTVPAESVFQSRFVRAEEGPTSSPSHGTHTPKAPTSLQTSGAAPPLLTVFAPCEGFSSEAAPRPERPGLCTDLNTLQSYKTQLLQKAGSEAHVSVVLETPKSHFQSHPQHRSLPNFLTPDSSPPENFSRSACNSSLYSNGRFSDCSCTESLCNVSAKFSHFDAAPSARCDGSREPQQHRAVRLPPTRLPSTEDVEDFFENLDRGKRTSARGHHRGAEGRGVVAGREGGSIAKQEGGGVGDNRKIRSGFVRMYNDVEIESCL